MMLQIEYLKVIQIGQNIFKLTNFQIKTHVLIRELYQTLRV
jgi:hypothetical protein